MSHPLLASNVNERIEYISSRIHNAEERLIVIRDDSQNKIQNANSYKKDDTKIKQYEKELMLTEACLQKIKELQNSLKNVTTFEDAKAIFETYIQTMRSRQNSLFYGESSAEEIENMPEDVRIKLMNKYIKSLHEEYIENNNK